MDGSREARGSALSWFSSFRKSQPLRKISKHPQLSSARARRLQEERVNLLKVLVFQVTPTPDGFVHTLARVCKKKHEIPLLTNPAPSLVSCLATTQPTSARAGQLGNSLSFPLQGAVLLGEPASASPAGAPPPPSPRAPIGRGFSPGEDQRGGGWSQAVALELRMTDWECRAPGHRVCVCLG